MREIPIILVVVLINVTAQLLLKHAMVENGAISLGEQSIFQVAIDLFTNPKVLVGLGLYGIGAFMWLIVLSRVSLSLAYPITSLSYVLLMFLAWHFFDESLSIAKAIGTTMIVAGVIVLNWTR